MVRNQADESQSRGSCVWSRLDGATTLGGHRVGHRAVRVVVEVDAKGGVDPEGDSRGDVTVHIQASTLTGRPSRADSISARVVATLIVLSPNGNSGNEPSRTMLSIAVTSS